MKKMIIFVLCFFVLIPFGNAEMYYQETPNTATNNGAYVYFNYTKPTYSLNTSLWQVKHGTLSTYNISIPATCWNYTMANIQFRIYSNMSGADGCSSYPQCYNGTWSSIGSVSYNSSFSGYEGDSWSNASLTYDGNWNTYQINSGGVGVWLILGVGVGYYEARIYEEAMYWNMTQPPTNTITIHSPQNITYLSTNPTLNWSSDTIILSSSYSLDGNANISITGNTTIAGLNYGAHNIIVYGTDYFSNTSNSKQYFRTSQGIININVYDEEAPTTPILSNLTITNGTTTLTYNNVSSQPIYMEDIRGILTITANDYAGLYSQRQISATMESGQNKTENIYLLLDSAGFQIDLNVYDSLSTGITGALVNISRQSGYSYNYVTECTTDSAGYCFVTLNDTATYKFVVSKSGYITKTQYITPTLTAYSFTLQTPTPSINFTSELGGVTMLLTPQITTLKKSDAQPFNFTITSNETLTSWGMQILWQNYTGTSLFSSTKSNVTGGSVNATINTTLYNGTVVVRTFLQRDGYSLRSYYTNYTIHTITPYNHSLYNFIPDVQTNYGGTFSNLFITLALLLFIVFAAALFGLGTEVSGALLFIGLGYLSFFGLIPFNLLLLAMILFMSYILWKG